VAVGADNANLPLAVGTGDGGATWAVEKLPKSTATMEDVSCPTSANCFATGADGTVMATTNAGESWRRMHVPSATDFLWAISCVDATHCWVLAENGPVLSTTDGGRPWVTQSPPGAPDLVGISCTSNTDCTAVGGNPLAGRGGGYVFSTTDGGTTWTPGTLRDQAEQL
jgi:photosystem II stability/assembly factor-like uncharacterized protein